jgi:hypothetical protein
MKLGYKGIVLTILTSTIMALAPAAHAAHATNFLNALRTEVTNRLATAGTNATARQKAALRAAGNVLSHNTKTLSADLSALATAATVLGTRFPNDATFASIESDALADYSAEAHAQLENAELHVGTNRISRLLSNQLARLQVALTNADNNSNGVPARARALARVFTQMRMPVAKILRMFPTIPFEAPASLSGGLRAEEDEPVVNDQTIYEFFANGTYHADDPEELGLWTYQKTGTKTAVMNLTPNFPATNMGPHTFNLTFTSATTGTYTGHSAVTGENFVGTFSLTLGL